MTLSGLEVLLPGLAGAQGQGVAPRLKARGVELEGVVSERAVEAELGFLDGERAALALLGARLTAALDLMPGYLDAPIIAVSVAGADSVSVSVEPVLAWNLEGDRLAWVIGRGATHRRRLP